MASWHDLKARCDRIGAGATYIGTPAHWLLGIVKDVQTKPVILNVKGVGAEQTVIVTTLTHYEELRMAAVAQGQQQGA